MESIKNSDGKLLLKTVDIHSGKVTDVRGMGASDAVFILENAGLQVKIKGTGKVKEQSIPPGSNYSRGSYVYLTLS